MGKKQKVLTEVFQICQQRGDYIFDNELIKDVCRRVGFKNPFDATKIDNKKILPDILIENDYAVMHLGNGLHQFIRGTDKIFHPFEPIQHIIEWPYHKSLLNEYNTSESNILSVANNQRILHHFLFGEDTEFDQLDIAQRPKTYFPHRTKTDLEYYFGTGLKVSLTQIQIEIDLTIEYRGLIGIFEAKNGRPENFSIYQLYHPFLYYHNAKQLPELSEQIQKIICVYVVRGREQGISQLRCWAYTFRNPLDITSIQLLKAACYMLIQEPAGDTR
jgi:hypothetical protein